MGRVALAQGPGSCGGGEDRSGCTIEERVARRSRTVVPANDMYLSMPGFRNVSLDFVPGQGFSA